MHPTKISFLVLSALAATAIGFSQDAGKWTLLNRNATTEVAGPSLTLPPDAQLVRRAPAGDFSLAIKSHPVISQAASSWPVVVIGDLALAIFEVEGEAAASVFRGDEIAHVFAPGVLLDRTGRAAVPLSISFKFTASGVAVAVNGESHLLEGVTLTPDAELDLTAGTHAPWILDHVSLERPAGPGSTTETAGDSAGTQAKGSDLAAIGSASTGGADGNGTGRDSRVSAIREQTSSTATALSASTLEVFTPPAVRKARVEAVREQLNLQK